MLLQPITNIGVWLFFLTCRCKNDIACCGVLEFAHRENNYPKRAFILYTTNPIKCGCRKEGQTSEGRGPLRRANGIQVAG